MDRGGEDRSDNRSASGEGVFHMGERNEIPEALIVRVIQSYHPTWEPPPDKGREWVQCLCAWHGDSHPSASVSYRNDAFKCFSCPATGDAIGIIMREEGISYKSAVERAESLSPGSAEKVQPSPARKSRRRAFGEQEAPGDHRRSVQARVRRRPSPWT